VFPPKSALLSKSPAGAHQTPQLLSTNSFQKATD
jgi:hypothetical protein